MNIRRFALVTAEALLASTAALVPSQQPQLRTLTPEMRIVSSDSLPQTQLSKVVDVLAAPDGFIFVLDNGSETGSVRLYNPAGKFVRSFGRRGDGPSEFSGNNELIGAAGDSVLVYDRGRGTIQVFLRSGAYSRTHTFAGIERGDRQLRGYLSGGRALFEIGYWHWPTNDSVAFRIADSSKREITRIAVQKAPPQQAAVARVVTSRQAFVPLVHAAQDPLGNRALAALPSVYWGGQPGQVKLVMMNRDGVQSEKIVNLGARRMTNAIRDAFIKTELDGAPDELRASGLTRASAEKELRDALVTGEFLPEIDRAMLGSDGAIWLRSYDDNDWLLVSPAGTITARVRVPAGVTVYQVSTKTMWGVIRDVDGLPIVIRYNLSAN